MTCKPGDFHPDVPALDCLTRGHILVEHTEPGAWPTENDQTPWASWCLWCGSGVSNEELPHQEETNRGQ